MSDFWNQLQSNVNSEIQDSGFLKNVFGRLQFLELAEQGENLCLRLGVPRQLSLSLVERDLQGLVRRQLDKLLENRDVEIQFLTTENQAEQAEVADLSTLDVSPGLDLSILRSPAVEIPSKWSLNPMYKMEHFVRGPHAEFAVQCLQLMTNGSLAPSRQLFLFGGSGLGKSHLLHALGWRMREMRPDLHIKVVSSDEFINDYHLYLTKKQMPEFRGKYRLKTDVLLIDDIQLMSRAKGAQEELFHVFNYFEQTGKWIAFTSDQSPADLQGFEPRLLTRFQGGLSAQIQTPNTETCLQILISKQRQYGFDLPNALLQSIAKTQGASVRTLEGALYKVGFFQRLKGEAVTATDLASLIPSVLNETPAITIQKILHDAALEHRLKVADLKSESRRAVIVRARGEAMLQMREALSMSYADIGREFGKDHSTVMSAIERARTRRDGVLPA